MQTCSFQFGMLKICHSSCCFCKRQQESNWRSLFFRQSMHLAFSAVWSRFWAQCCANSCPKCFQCQTVSSSLGHPMDVSKASALFSSWVLVEDKAVSARNLFRNITFFCVTCCPAWVSVWWRMLSTILLLTMQNSQSAWCRSKLILGWSVGDATCVTACNSTNSKFLAALAVFWFLGTLCVHHCCPRWFEIQTLKFNFFSRLEAKLSRYMNNVSGRRCASNKTHTNDHKSVSCGNNIINYM